MNRRRIPVLPLLAALAILVAGGAVFLWQQRSAMPPGPLVGADVGGPFSLVAGDGYREACGVRGNVGWGRPGFAAVAGFERRVGFFAEEEVGVEPLAG